MKKTVFFLFVALFFCSNTGFAAQAADYNSTAGVHAQTVTFVNQSPGYANTNVNGAYTSFTIPLVITASGRGFFVANNCTLSNDAGIGVTYRLAIATFVDGVLHGETQSGFIPQVMYYPETISGASNIEGIDPNTISTHVFELKVAGVGIAATLECNLSVMAYQ